MLDLAVGSYDRAALLVGVAGGGNRESLGLDGFADLDQYLVPDAGVVLNMHACVYSVKVAVCMRACMVR